MKFLKIFLVLLVPVLLLACIVFLTTGAGSYKAYVIHTGSMSPTIPSGSAVLVHEGHYHVGQVITFTEDGLTVTHRLVSISAAGLTTTKGDANSTNDPWHVPKSQIIGGVVLAPRYVGYAITYLKDPLGLGSVLLGVLFIWQISAMMRTDEPKGEETNGSTPRKPRKRVGRRRAPLPIAVPELVAYPALALEERGDYEPAVPELVTSSGESLSEQSGVRPVFSWSGPTTGESRHEVEVIRPAFPRVVIPAKAPESEPEPEAAVGRRDFPIVTAAYSPPRIEEVRPAFPWSVVATKNPLPNLDQNHGEGPNFVGTTVGPLPKGEQGPPDVSESVPLRVDSLEEGQIDPAPHDEAVTPAEAPNSEILETLPLRTEVEVASDAAPTQFEEVHQASVVSGATEVALPVEHEAAPAISEVEAPAEESTLVSDEPVPEPLGQRRADYSWLFGPTRGAKGPGRADRP